MANNSLIKKGKCLNLGNQCPNADSKKVLEIDTLEPFICPHCNTDLVPVKNVDGPNWLLIAIAMGLVLAIGSGAYYWFVVKPSAEVISQSPVPPPGGENEGIDGPLPVSPDSIPDKTSNNETSKENGTPFVLIDEPEGGDDPLLNGKGTISYPYGKYTGDIRDGKAHGIGVLRYNKQTLISDKGNKKRYAEGGDYIMGSFRNNRIMQVEWYQKDGTLKEVIQEGSGGLD